MQVYRQSKIATCPIFIIKIEMDGAMTSARLTKCPVKVEAKIAKETIDRASIETYTSYDRLKHCKY